MNAHERARADAIATALDELRALTRGGWAPSTYRGLLHYVTESTRATVRRVTGLTIRPGDRWTAEDCDTAATALLEATPSDS